MYFITPGIRVFKKGKLKILSIMLLQSALICVSFPVVAQNAGIEPGPVGGAAGDTGTDLVDCIFKDGFEACLVYIEGYPDTDSDGFGDGASESSIFCNVMRVGFVDNALDCNDAEELMFPGNAESCDGLDNDCNAVTADGAGDPDLGKTCDGLDTDLCEEGTLACGDGSLVCSDNTDSTLDVCDGLDNDCDAQSADGEEDPGLGMACDGPDGDLCDEGTLACSNGSLACSDTSSDDLDVCDGVDNDCDTSSADGSEDPSLGEACDGIDTDLCKEGTLACSGGSMSCSDISSNNYDICDGLDNDCDLSSVDGSEDPELGLVCDTGQYGICADGERDCIAGALVCTVTVSPGFEVCDGLDNDCDGTPDDGNPGGGASCATGQLGVCATGTTNCIGGSIACAVDNPPSAEVCDGLDNDCDGTHDEGNPGGGASCETGQPGVCAIGIMNCANGSLACAATVSPIEEICDGLDNDCDGTPDEGNPGGGARCETGWPGVCSIGTTSCTDGALMCAADVEPSEEICDGYDNDCDGHIDEGCGVLGDWCSLDLHCSSNHCAYGVCCDSACDGTDESCVEVDTGAPDGTCTMVIIGDPFSELGQ